MKRKFISFLIILSSLAFFESNYPFIISCVVSGYILKSEGNSFMVLLILGFSSSMIAILFKPIYLPSIQLFGDLFGGLNSWLMIFCSVLFTAITAALLIKTTALLTKQKQ